ncbi:bifunctional glutamine synthetase adenylyltransferase/deadenyltransferase, partial [Vibrio fortis]
ERDGESLKQEVVKMREKMRDHLGGKKIARFMLKQDNGGITDVEFLAQYLVLRYSHEKPKLTRWCDNVRIFESLMSQGIMEEPQAMALTHAYTTLRDEIHHRNLLNLDADVAMDKFEQERALVTQAWQQWMLAE